MGGIRLATEIFLLSIRNFWSQMTSQGGAALLGWQLRIFPEDLLARVGDGYDLGSPAALVLDMVPQTLCLQPESM